MSGRSSGKTGSRSKSGECSYKLRCKAFLDSLNIHDAFFEPKTHICYCKTCLVKREDQPTSQKGNPPKTYALPTGWCRFGLCVPKRVQSLNAFEKWHRAYHGTVADKIKPILNVGDIVPAGTKVMGARSELKPRPGHFSTTSAPSGFNVKRVFVSPSIRYAGHEAYASPARFTEPYSLNSSQVQVAFQVLINPGSYDVMPQTIGATSKIDYNFSNSELEWATDKHGAVILYGLLVKIS